MSSGQKLLKINIGNNADSVHFRFQVSPATLKALAVLFSILGFVFILFLVDYAHMLQLRPEYSRVRSEHHVLSANLNYVRERLTDLQSQISQTETLTGQIEKIVDFFQRGPLSMVNTATELIGADLVDQSAPIDFEKSELDKQSIRLHYEQQFLSEPVLHYGSPTQDSMTELSNEIQLAVYSSQALEHKVLNLWESLSEKRNFFLATPSIKPAYGWFSSLFGIRRDPFNGRPTMHSGLDIAGPTGTKVMSTADGVVVHAGRYGGYGNFVSVDHGYGIQTRYAHLSKIYVRSGDTVKRFDAVGAMGSTGRSTSTHLHYEVRVRGAAVNPAYFILDLPPR